MRLLIAFLIFSFSSYAQVGTGQWRLHIPSNGVGVAVMGGSVYTAYEKGVSEYDETSGELSFWDAVNGLSDITISSLEGCSSDNSVFIGYENGNLDKIKGNEVTNIPAIKLAQIQGSKTIFKMVEYDEHMYLATGFSIVKIDPKKNEVRDTYYPTNGNAPIQDLVFLNDSIYALSDERMFRGSISNPALADPAQWEIDNRVPVATDSYSDIEVMDGELYILSKNNGYGYDSLYHVTNSGLVVPMTESFTWEISSLNSFDNKLCVNFFGGSRVYLPNFTADIALNLYANGAFPNPSDVVFSDNKYWIADGNIGLVEYKGDYLSSLISFSGPPKSDFYAMDYARGRMAFTSGGLSQVAPTFNQSGVYLFDDEEWELRNRSNMEMWDEYIFDFLSVSMNPNDKNQIAVGTYSYMPVSIMDETGQVIDTLSPHTTPLEWTTLGNDWSLVSEVKYDDQGNLWVLNGYSNEPLKVRTSEGDWYSFSLGAVAKSKFTQKMVIDYQGNKWMSVKGAGLFGYNDAGTISAASDDRMINLNVGENTGALPSNEVTAIAVDFDNEIWVGTDNGFAVLYYNEGMFDGTPGDYNAQRIKLEFEGNVEYVLGATSITDIEVDGANRKWFGTANAGIILLSADGLEILEHHTVENSPLISDNIIDLKLNHETGELFIITDQGLISYRTDATYEDPEYTDVKVFPNPARPEFDGPITIQGIRYNSDVRITDVAGNLVFKTTSNGGTATWNGKTLDGDPVKTGVYLIWTAANEGKGRHVGKVLVVN
jgi:ligand-binding sensor domain-containing protein